MGGSETFAGGSDGQDAAAVGLQQRGASAGRDNTQLLEQVKRWQQREAAQRREVERLRSLLAQHGIAGEHAVALRLLTR
jgi:hypothetical protein